MEDLLASIRKAIHDDIGDTPGGGLVRVPYETAPPEKHRRPAERHQVPVQSDIQQLREKISRVRPERPAAPPEPARRAASLAAALQSDTPRRNWRELEPAPFSPVKPVEADAPRLRGTVVEPEAVRPAPPPPVPRVDISAFRPAPAPVAVPARPDAAAMLSGGSAQVVQSAFNKLADSVLARATSERSLEDVTREMLRVMLKQWLDENLPAMVERMVREEIERVARTGR